MSDGEEEEVYGFYGKPLEQYDEDAIPKKRPITVEEQIATDAQGRRRFHGAFTGGFSAGFYNTVGSLEGWKPSEFKSSRSEKAERKSQRPEDYMDDEDIGEFGIAPQTVRATNDYNTSKKRKKVAFSEGPIPGEPVLHSLIASGNDTIGYLLLRNIGYKQTEKEEEETAPTRVYGCVMPKTYEIKRSLENYQYEVPEIYKSALRNPKSNTFGLSYVGLDKGNINLFKSQSLVVQERNNKKVSISGQAFGIGAFEEEDEDIYVREDLSNYDFEMTKEKEKAAVVKPKDLVFDLFVPSKSSLEINESFPPPSIPHSFSGKHKVRKSRFEPVIEKQSEPVKRHEIDASVRARYLGEPEVVRKEPVREKEAMVVDESPSSSSRSSSVSDIQPKSERVGGFKFKDEGSMAGLILDRFVSASKPEMLDQVEAPEESLHGTKDMRDAAKSKMFGMLTRTSTSWLPNSLLCKRFNIPEPNFSDSDLKPRQRRPINLIFESEKNVEDTPLDKVGLQIQNKTITIEDDMVNSTETPKQTEGEPMPPVPSTSENSIPPIHNSKKDTPVHLLKDPTEKLDVSKNIDLFKAVFMDSDSESDTEQEANKESDTNKEKEERERQETFKEQVLAVEPVLPKIKPMREGILSNVSFIKFSKPVSSKDVTPAKEECEKKEVVDLYGPMLPQKKVITPEVIQIDDMSSDDMWIEKDEKQDGKKRKEHKHKKKSKKEKHKKKHKHKK